MKCIVAGFESRGKCFAAVHEVYTEFMGEHPMHAKVARFAQFANRRQGGEVRRVERSGLSNGAEDAHSHDFAHAALARLQKRADLWHTLR